MPKRKVRIQENPLNRSDTVLQESPHDESDKEEDSPTKKKQKVGKKLSYSTTTVLRTLDEEGEDIPLVKTLRSASFHTKKVLKQQLLKERKAVTPEQQVLYKILYLRPYKLKF